MKSANRENTFAILGGTPAFPDPIHVGRPNLGDRSKLLERFNQVLDNRWFTNNGPFLLEFENQLAQYLGVKDCIAVCNATVGLEIAIRALGLRGEVIVPAFTFVATAHALQWQEISPVFCDIDPHTHNIDPLLLESLITPKTTGIIGVHVWGTPCVPEALVEISKTHGLKLLFDAAHAFGCSHNGKRVGSLGNAEIFSFHATKFFNTFEGGAIATNDDELASRIRLMRNFGFSDYDTVVHIGTNGKMNEMCAAMGLTSLESIDSFIEVNKRNHSQYREFLGDVPGVHLMAHSSKEQNNHQYVVLELDSQMFGMTRDMLQKVLWAENVRARRYFYPGCHRMAPYSSLYPGVSERLKVTEAVCERVLTLPTGSGVERSDIETICTIIRSASTHKESLGKHFASQPTFNT